MAKCALVTGGTGQDGTYLIDLLLAKGYVVHAQSRRQPQLDRHGSDSVQWHVGQLVEVEFLDAMISAVRPDEIYNLAAVSSPTISWTLPIETARLNAFVPQQICELIRKHCPESRLFQASSSAMFGDSAERVQSETTRCDPKTPYAIAKHYAHRMIGAYRDQYGLRLYSGIMFNHESSRRPLSFVSQKIAHAAAALHLGLSETKELDERGQPLLYRSTLKLGNLNVRRDFGYAGDFVEAMQAIVQTDLADDYVIGTAETHSIAEFCELAFNRVGLDWRKHVVVDAELKRSVDAPALCADATKLRINTGWVPKVTFEELVETMVKARIAFIKHSMSGKSVR